MTQLGGDPHAEVVGMRDVVKSTLDQHRFDLIQADDVVTGRDFLLKIWGIAVASPLGIAIVHESMTAETVANIFYELGLMQAYGRETLVLKSPRARIPSDLVRTEWVQFDDSAPHRLARFMEGLQERVAYYLNMADQLERNPLLVIDYLRRAYLLTEDPSIRETAIEVFDRARIEGRARNSLEHLLVQF
jgi:hypothetical protein